MASYTARKNKAGEIVSYQIKVTRGRDKLTGKQLTPFTTTYTPPEGWGKRAVERDLMRFMGEFEAACKRGEVLTKEQQKQLEQDKLNEAERQRLEEARKPTFKRYVESLLQEMRITNAPGTIENYNMVLRRAGAVFNDYKLEDITPAMVRAYIMEYQANGKNEKTGKPVAYRTVEKHYVVLHRIFQSAVENEILSVSPMQNMKRPKPRKDEVKKAAVVYTEEQVQYIYQCLNKEPLKWKALVMFAIDSGCRRGEIVGLKWSEIDFKSGKVNICRNAQYTNGIGTYISTPKNRKNRVIYLNRPVLAVLAEWKKQQALLHFGQGIPLSGFCFTQDNGEMMNPQSPTSYLIQFGKKYNLPGIHPHALRHTMATLSIANGADVVSISEKLGHAEPSITLNVYSHANEEAQRRANKVLEDALYSKKKA